jgi:hypothetical protein
MKFSGFFKTLVLCFCFIKPAIARDDLNRQMVSAANSFLNTLTEDQKKLTVHTLTDSVRYDWHYTPRERKGITLKQMTTDQGAAAMTLIKVVLSKEGFLKAEQIIDLENVLRVLEKRSNTDTWRDPENYAFLIFGTPDSKEPWGWRVEGHHLSLHFSSINGHVTFTPSFMGSNPGHVLIDVPQKGRRVLSKEEDLGFQLLSSLDDKQLKIALLGEKAPYEMLTTNSRKAHLEKIEGLPLGEMTHAQQKLFLSLLDSYLDRYHVTLKNQQMKELQKASLDAIRFVWMGDKEAVIGKGHGHYYRIHGPTILIEFDNTQNDGNHIHTVVRDLTNDFGEDLLQQHYQKMHRPKK